MDQERLPENTSRGSGVDLRRALAELAASALDADRRRAVSTEIFRGLMDVQIAELMRPINGQAPASGWSGFVRAVGEIAQVHASTALFVWWQIAMARIFPHDVASAVAQGERVFGIAYASSNQTCELSMNSSGDSVTGMVRNVLFGNIATDILVLVPVVNRAGIHGVSPQVLLRIPVAQVGVSYELVPSKGLKAAGICHFTFRNAHVEKHNVSGAAGLGTQTLSEYVTVVRGLGLCVDIYNAVGALDWVINNSRKKYSMGKPLLKWQAVQFKISDGDVKLRMLQDMAAYLAWAIDHGRKQTEPGLPLHHYGLLLGAMYRLNGAQIQEDCLELGCGRVYREDHRNWRRYMDYITLRLLFGPDDWENRVLGEALFAQGDLERPV